MKILIYLVLFATAYLSLQVDAQFAPEDDPCATLRCGYGAMCVVNQDGEAHCKCPSACTREYRPVCGSDGTTYSNICVLRAAACENKQDIKFSEGKCKTTRSVCPEFCTAEYKPVCGSDGRTYDNNCALERAACNTKVRKVSEGSCPTARPCPSFCPLNYLPICGTDGKTYGNECQLNVAACKSKNKNLKKRYNGRCLQLRSSPDFTSESTEIYDDQFANLSNE